MMNLPDMTTKTVASRFRILALVCVLAAGVLLAYLTLSPPQSALTQDTGISIADAQAVEEGGNAEFVVTMNATSSQEVRLTWTVSGGMDDPAMDNDFATTTGVVVFPATSVSGTTTTITIQTMDDDVVESDESFIVTIATTTSLIGVSISDGEATGTITNDDTAEITIADASADEGTGVQFTVRLSASVSKDSSLTWSTSDGTATTADNDYTSEASRTVSFPAGSAAGATMTVSVQTTQDAVVEPDETFKVTLATSTLIAGVSISDGEATGTITNDDTAEITVADASAEEGQPAVFTIKLSASVSQDSSFTWSTADGTAEQPGDYTEVTPRLVTFPAGSGAGATTTITIQTVGDDVVEPDEDFAVMLATSTLIAGVSISDGEATGTITNDDTATITIADASAEEGDDVEFTVTLSASVSEAVSLTWTTTDGTAEQPGDYTAVMADTVSFDANSGAGATKTLTVDTVEDVVVEPGETFTVKLATSTPLLGGVSFSRREATGTITNDDTATITIEDASAEEGQGVQFTVKLSASVSEDSSLTWSTADGTATTADNDYTAETSGTVSFPGGSVAGATMNITVQTTQDVVVEPDERFTVTLSTSTLIAGVSIAGDGEATGTIRNDDSASIAITDAPAVDEGAAVQFTVTLTAPVDQVVNLTWSTADDTATAADNDYTAETSGTVFFSARSTTTTFTVQTKEDDVVEPDESFRVTIVGDNLPANVTVDVDSNVGTGSITNDDTATITIEDAEAVSEGVGAVFTVKLSAQVSQVVRLTWSVAGGMVDPTEDGDFVTTSGTESFSALSTTTTITVQTVDDEVVEPAESFRVTIVGDNLPDDVTVDANDDVGTGSITNNDTASISIADASAAEGDGVDFVVTLSKPVSQAVNLTWATMDGSAMAPGDYTATTSGMVSFGANSAVGATMTVTVETEEDDVVEPAEDFTVTLATSTPLLAGVSFGKDVATGTIRNDDSANITITDGTAVEGGSVTFTVRLSKSVSEDVSLNWASSNVTAVAGVDYTAVTSGMVLFPANSDAGTTTTVTVQTLDEAVVEPVERFRVTLTAAGTLLAGVIIADGVGIGDITNDDTAFISIEDASTEEGDTVDFVVTLSASVSEVTRLTWSTTDGTAEAPSDYTAVVSRVVSFPADSDPGATTTITVRTVEERVVEPEENFTVTLSTSSLIAGVSIVDGEAIGTITNDDTAGITIADGSAEEGEGVEFVVTLNASVSEQVSLTWSTADGTAVAGGDYTATTSGMVMFPANSDPGTTMTVTVDTREDAVVEPPESFSVSLATTTPLLLAGVSIVDGVATGRITNDDTAAITIADARAEEGESVVFVVRLSASVSEQVNLNWSTSDGTAVAPADYTAVSGDTVSFGPNSAPGATTTVTVMTVEDAVVEPVESFRVKLSGTLLSGVRIADGVGIGSITNDDSARITVSDARASEGREVEFIVRLSASVSQDVTLTWTTVDVTAEGIVDYDAVATGTVTFVANSGPGATKTITVETFGDGVIEPSERFVVMISATTLLSGVRIADAEATGTIVNDDTAPITVRTPTPIPTAVPVLVVRSAPTPSTRPSTGATNPSDAPSAGATPTPVRIVATRVPVVLVAPTPTPTPIPTPSPTPLPTPTQTPAPTPTTTPTPTPLPTPTPSPIRLEAPTPTPSPTASPTPTQTPTATPTPATALLVDPSTPSVLTETEQAQRTRSALELVTSAGRERLTLVVVLVPILVVVGIAFAYLILRRR